MIDRFVVLVTFLFLAGCASNKLNIEVDLYNEDPEYVIPLTPTKAAEVSRALDGVHKNVTEVERARIAKGFYDQAVFSVSACVSNQLEKQIGNAQRNKEDENTQPLIRWKDCELSDDERKTLQQYIVAVKEKAAKVRRMEEGASKDLAVYLEAYAEVWQPKSCSEGNLTNEKKTGVRCVYKKSQKNTDVTAISNSVDTASLTYSRRLISPNTLESETGFNLRMRETILANSVQQLIVQYVMFTGDLGTEFENKKRSELERVRNHQSLLELEEIPSLKRSIQVDETKLSKLKADKEGYSALKEKLTTKREKLWGDIDEANSLLQDPVLRSDALFQLNILKNELDRVDRQLDVLEKQITDNDGSEDRLQKRVNKYKETIAKQEKFRKEFASRVAEIASEELSSAYPKKVNTFPESDDTDLVVLNNLMNRYQREVMLTDAVRNVGFSIQGDLRENALENVREMVIGTSVFYNVLDRLQDPGNPVWRILTSSYNKDNWNEKVAHSYFKAQGNSSVVVVRDSPLKFRIQQGKNDPAALIESQLAISRSIASATFSVLAATQGLSLPDQPELSEGETDVSASRPNVTAEQAALQRSLEDQASLELFSQILSNLGRNLQTSRTNLERITPGASEGEDQQLRAERQRLESLLTQYKALLAGLKE